MSERRTILVVDDDYDLRDALAGLLEDVGYRAETAANGVEAMKTLHDGLRPDVILLDLMMPESDGYDFRARQRAVSELADIPVVAMTASGRAEADVPSLHAVAFLRKPFDFDALVALLQRIIEARAT